ncbi:alkaline phosphatase family protein [Amycolatopsis antarctica]|uniref:Alkaline phosphatase family protein n=1 Tax=Amycolatopsis antarctica TaxID=1854586 RepID=A0A263D6T0_9PSEU|nr:alkaline phosphatase family protein [Amycolatopsis antarctica]OZM74170.1 alkaline phosphatase family protein [Amycolatopsis antarctica]
MDIPVPDESVPHLARVVPSLLRAIGTPGFTGSLGLRDGLARACVLLVDGLGWELLDQHAEDAPVLAGLARTPLRAGYPATTAAGLAALGTGAESGEHGMVGYSFEVPGTGVLNALSWCHHPGGPSLADALAPGEVQRLPTTFATAADAGVAVSVVSAAEFAGTPLTRAVLHGGRYVGVHALGDLAASVIAALGPAPAFCYAYHSELDKLGHIHGPGTPPWRMQLRQVDRLVESIVDGLPAGAVLAVVADHGMVGIDGTAVDLDAAPELAAGVRALGGEVRARHVYTMDGATEDVLTAWRETLGDRAWVVRGEEAIGAGWFGRVADHVRPRIGDLVAAARGRSGLLRRAAEPMESGLIGQHGSHSTAEQLVPLALAYG